MYFILYHLFFEHSKTTLVWTSSWKQSVVWWESGEELSSHHYIFSTDLFDKFLGCNDKLHDASFLKMTEEQL
ncbi:hypothetical protein COOONC_12389 [Cooperia oncophora]